MRDGGGVEGENIAHLANPGKHTGWNFEQAETLMICFNSVMRRFLPEVYPTFLPVCRDGCFS